MRRLASGKARWKDVLEVTKKKDKHSYSRKDGRQWDKIRAGPLGYHTTGSHWVMHGHRDCRWHTKTDRRTEGQSEGRSRSTERARSEWDAICNTKPRRADDCHAHITGRDVTTKTSNYFSSSDFYCNIGRHQPQSPFSGKGGRTRAVRNCGRRAVPGHIRRGEQRWLQTGRRWWPMSTRRDQYVPWINTAPTDCRIPSGTVPPWGPGRGRRRYTTQ